MHSLLELKNGCYQEGLIDLKRYGEMMVYMGILMQGVVIIHDVLVNNKSPSWTDTRTNIQKVYQIIITPRIGEKSYAIIAKHLVI